MGSIWEGPGRLLGVLGGLLGASWVLFLPFLVVFFAYVNSFCVFVAIFGPKMPPRVDFRKVWGGFGKDFDRIWEDFGKGLQRFLKGSLQTNNSRMSLSRYLSLLLNVSWRSLGNFFISGTPGRIWANGSNPPGRILANLGMDFGKNLIWGRSLARVQEFVQSCDRVSK